MASFPYKTAPYDHQRRALRWLAGRKYAGLFMEQRTGKTKVTLDRAASEWLAGRIGALVVIAPAGVHTNWTRDEIPLHLSDAVPRRVIEWSASKARQRGFQDRFRAAVRESDGGKALFILAINIESVTTDLGKSAIRNTLKRWPSLLVVDESTDIKTPSAKRTKAIKALGRLASQRLILSGFPDPEGPVDLYPQLSFLSPHIVGTNVASFRAEYCEFEQRFYRGAGAPPVQVVVGYRNLDKLQGIVAQHCFRVRRDEVFDMPPKAYTKRYFEMSAEQWRMYSELREEWRTSFEDGEEVSADLTIVRKGRLQQIASGYVPTDNPDAQEPIRRIPGPNPRLEALLDSLRRYPYPTIIWTRYRMDGDLLMENLGDDAVRYDGTVKAEMKELAKRRFQKEGKAQYFIANAQSAGRGLTLHRAQVVHYFSHFWSLELRVQSEDRPLSPTNAVTYVDLIASDTVDEEIVDALRAKDDLARRIIGDPLRAWI